MDKIKVYDDKRDGDIKHFAGRIAAPYMPEPPEDKVIRLIECGAITFGIEYRFVGHEKGVSIHVFGNNGGKRIEYLRFDCLDERPHYHYVSFEKGYQDRFFIDAVADGDPVAWSLDRIRTRLPWMLARAGATELGKQIEPELLERAASNVAQATYDAISKCNAP